MDKGTSEIPRTNYETDDEESQARHGDYTGGGAYNHTGGGAYNDTLVVELIIMILVLVVERCSEL